MNLCDEIEKDYKSHPEHYIDVTQKDDIDYPSYTDRYGNYWCFAMDANGISVLGEEGVFALCEVQKYVKKKD